MRALIFDPLSGASGDMIMASLLHLGAEVSRVRDAVESVGCSLDIAEVTRGHIQALKATVTSDRRFKSLDEAVTILKDSSLQNPWSEKALEILNILAGAEGVIHGEPRNLVRFHEIGTLDALADIAGCCAALESLEAERVLCTRLSVGRGSVPTAHGHLPVPAPATLEILRSWGIPWRGGPSEGELLTPTGAAILAGIVDGFLDEYPSWTAQATGYGAGSRDLEFPNLLRSVMGALTHHHQGPQVLQIETNVDDCTGEVIGHLIGRLMEAGALDVAVMPAVMKKGRSGHVISVMAREEEANLLAEMIIRETGSLGVRFSPLMHRIVALRQEMEVEVSIDGKTHQARVKIGRLEGNVITVKPEYEDCQHISSETGMPLRDVTRMIEIRARGLIVGDGSK